MDFRPSTTSLAVFFLPRFRANRGFTHGEKKIARPNLTLHFQQGIGPTRV